MKISHSLHPKVVASQLTKHLRRLEDLVCCQHGSRHPKQTPGNALLTIFNRHVCHVVRCAHREPSANKHGQSGRVQLSRSSNLNARARNALSEEGREHGGEEERHLLVVVVLRGFGALEFLENGVGNLAFDGVGGERSSGVRVVGLVAGISEDGHGVDVGNDGEDIVGRNGEERVIEP